MLLLNFKYEFYWVEFTSHQENISSKIPIQILAFVYSTQKHTGTKIYDL